MKPRDRFVRLSYFAPAWFLGRHSAMYVQRYSPSGNRRPRTPDDDGAGASAATEPR